MECFAACGLQKDGTPVAGAPQLSRAERALAAANANLRLALRLFALRDEAALGALQEAGDATTTASTTAAPTPAPFNPFTDGGAKRRTRRTRRSRKTKATTAAAAATTTTTTTTTTSGTPPANTEAPTPAVTTEQRDALQAELAAVQAQIPDCKGEATCLADLNEVIKTIRKQLQ
jgi:hypothetical protein